MISENGIRRVMVVGSNEVYAIENFYVKHIRAMGVEVDHFIGQSMFYSYYNDGIINKVLFKLGLSGIIKKINESFLDRVDAFKPEVIWVFKGMELMPASLEKVKKLGIKLVNYNPDNPFLFTGRGSGNRYVTESIPLYDFHFSYSLEILKTLKERFDCDTEFLPFGFEIENRLFDECERLPELNKVCFLGNPDVKRAKFIQELADGGVKIDVYGHGWKRFVSGENIDVFDPVYGDSLWKKLRQYRVQLNLMRVHNESSHNMRSFEVPAIGGIMLAPDTPEHRLFFDDRVQVFLFESLPDCRSLIDTILGLSPEEAVKIRNSARLRSVSDGYCYRDRARFVMDTLNAKYG